MNPLEGEDIEVAIADAAVVEENIQSLRIPGLAELASSRQT